MSLAPFPILCIVKLESNDCIIDEFDVDNVSDVFPVSQLLRLKHFKCFLKIGEEESNRICSALFVWVGKVLELTIPSIRGRIAMLANCDPSDRVNYCRIVVKCTISFLLEDFPTSMTK
jgi:hypothetical protein